MAFDINNPADLLALTNEGLLPQYVALNGETQAILNLLNDPANNDTPDNGVDKLTAEALLDVIFDVAISSQDQFKIQLLFEGTDGLGGDLSRFRAKLSALSTSIANAIATIVRPLNRAEVLFGGLDEVGTYENVKISKTQWIAARNS